jgi:tungstate transport system substrate-binding protein
MMHLLRPLVARQIVASDEGQAIIRNYGKSQYKEALYNDAAYAKQYVQ